MTNEELEKADKALLEYINLYKAAVEYDKAELADARRQRDRLKNIMLERSKSPYKGEFHIKSEFRLKYKVPFSQLTEEEKTIYRREREEIRKRRGK